MGEGAKRADKRRDWVRLEENKMYWDREAQWMASVRWVGLVHRERFFLNEYGHTQVTQMTLVLSLYYYFCSIVHWYESRQVFDRGQ